MLARVQTSLFGELLPHFGRMIFDSGSIQMKQYTALNEEVLLGLLKCINIWEGTHGGTIREICFEEVKSRQIIG